jgi:hypothetical protein
MSAPDPLRSFRGVVTVTLVLEGVVALLALLVVANLGDGLNTWQGVLVGGLALVFFAACGFAGRPWILPAVLVLHALLIIGWLAATAIGILGVLFGLVWAILWWFRHDVARRMAEGRLPGQQQSTQD